MPPADLLNRFDSSAIGGEFDGFASGAMDYFETIFDLSAFSCAFEPPLDVIASLKMNFGLATDENLIAEFTR